MFTIAKEGAKIVLSGLIAFNLAASFAYAQGRHKTTSKRATPAKAFPKPVSREISPFLAASSPLGVPLPTAGGPGFVTSPAWPAFTLGQAATNLATLGPALGTIPGLRPGELFSSSTNSSDTLTHNMNIFDAADVIRAESESWIHWRRNAVQRASDSMKK